MGEELYAEGTKAFDFVDCKTIRTSGAKVAAISNGLGDDVWGERRGRRVQRAPLVEVPLHTTCLDMFPGGTSEDAAEHLLTGGTRRG